MWPECVSTKVLIIVVVLTKVQKFFDAPPSKRQSNSPALERELDTVTYVQHLSHLEREEE